MSPMPPIYKRVVIKISGDAFRGSEPAGIDFGEVATLARRFKKAREAGAELAVVVGAGNLVRGRDLIKLNVTRTAADRMGMLGTVINGLALQDGLERLDVEARLLSAIPVGAVAQTYDHKQAIRYLEQGSVVILVAGTGSPYFTTDTAAALRACEIGADVLMKATKVDGVYSADPLLEPSAKRFEFLSYLDILNRRLEVMDSTAVTLCMVNKVPIIVFDMSKEENIAKALRGEQVGTLIGEVSNAH